LATIFNMEFYDLSKKKRLELLTVINQDIADDLCVGNVDRILGYFSDEDTYNRKVSYQAIGKIYKSNKNIKSAIIETLKKLFESDLTRVRQTTINAAGEIGMVDFDTVEIFFNKGLFDHHHSVRNAVIGSIKKMGEKNPRPVLKWARQYLCHQNKEIRKEICHGIELRGRTHPQDILPMLEELQHDKNAEVRKMLIHVLGQISYKKGCLEKVIKALNTWDNKNLVEKALEEILAVHERYKNFAFLTRYQAIEFIDKNYK
jgi:3-methyladenine DNA glycosylase AlkC